MEKRSSIVFGHQKTISKQDAMLWKKNILTLSAALRFSNPEINPIPLPGLNPRFDFCLYFVLVSLIVLFYHIDNARWNSRTSVSESVHPTRMSPWGLEKAWVRE